MKQCELWGIGPGAHSHLEGWRWWNVKHPHTYAQRVSAGLSPMHDEEHLTSQQQALETLMLGLRMKRGIARTEVACGDEVIDELQDRELINQALIDDEPRLVLTRKGRLLADYVIRTLAA